MSKLQENLKSLPDKPGVYLHKDAEDNVIYVGKASSLKNRVRQYFQSSKRMDPKMRALTGQIYDFEYIVTGNEVEALILENNLIKKYMPKYNVLLRDDKTFPYIKITMAEEYPRLLKTRILANDGSKYFGPYADVKSVNNILDLLNNIFKLKRCKTQIFPSGFRPCLNGHIEKCAEICTGKIDKSKYMESINAVIAFLKGQSKKVNSYLEEKMKAASKNLDFEEAAKYRDYLAAANSVIRKQRVELLSSGDVDIVLSSDVDENQIDADITVFFVRDGKLSGREIHKIHRPENESNKETVAAFLKQYYSSYSSLPREIILEEHIDDEELVEELLTDYAERKVKIIVPKVGQKKALLSVAQKDIAESARVRKAKLKKETEINKKIGLEISNMFMNDSPPKEKILRLEAYDISHTGGVDAVGAMVVFNGTKPDKKSYRRFKIKSEITSDDYGSMQEVLYRRISRAKNKDKGFLPLPDLILLDGGLGHVNSVNQVLNGFKLKIPTAGMVKDDKHRTRGLIVGEHEISLKEYPELKHLIGNIQEEVHRFAITYHRNSRSKSAVISELDKIQGVGEKTRNCLLKEFGSVDNIKKASFKEIVESGGLNRTVAKNIVNYFENKE